MGGEERDPNNAENLSFQHPKDLAKVQSMSAHKCAERKKVRMAGWAAYL